MQARAHPRFAIELDAELVLDGGSSVHGRTQDISRGGFCVLTPATSAVAPGTACTVKLALVFSETEFSEQLSLRAVVAWCTPLKAGVQVGVKFDSLDAQSKNYLDLFIRFLEEGPEDGGPDEPEDDEGPGHDDT
jgi:hypothetical protein